MNALALVLAVAVFGDEPLPVQKGLVSDFAGIIDAETAPKIEALLAQTQKGGKAVLAVATVKTAPGSAEDYSAKLANAWGIGKKKENNGILLLIVSDEKTVRIEVGYGMEPTLTDIDSKRIIEKIMVPRFKDGKYSDGVLQGATAISAKVYDGKIPDSLDAKPAPAPVPMGLIVVLVIVVIVMLCFEPTRMILFVIIDIATGGKGSGGSSSSKSSGSSGGSFGGGGSTGKW
jgi:uncharacterized protein